MTREILPNIMAPIIVELTVRIGYAIFTVSTLTFLGVGVQRPSPDWGLAISDGDDLLRGGHMVAGDVPGARHRHPGHRGQPDRRLDPVGVRPMTVVAPIEPASPAATNAALDVRDLHVDYIVRG